MVAGRPGSKRQGPAQGPATSSVPDADQPLYHMCRRAEWQAAQAVGVYEGSSQDAADGFIHFSTRGQVAASAAKHRAGQTGLVLLTVDSAALGDALRWEPARGGALFPHLYGPLDTAAVAAVDDLPLGADGTHVFPFAAGPEDR